MKYIIIFLVAITIASCHKREMIKNTTGYGYSLTYDTLIIKGVHHEFILSKFSNGYQIVHSPECPCLKNKED